MRKFPVAFFLALLLTACLGGGGGESSSTSSPTPSPTPSGQDLQTSVPEPNYGDDPYRLTIFQGVNDIRRQLGMGLLAQSSQLDQAVESHSSNVGAKEGADRIYGNMNNVNSLTGLTPQDRCAYVNYSGACPDTGIWGGTIHIPFGPEWDLFDHYSALLVLSQGAREMGISSYLDIFMIPVAPYIQLGYPTGTSPQRQGAGFQVATYLWDAFHVQVNEGEALTVDAFQVWDAANHEVTGQILTSETDPYHRIPANAAMLVHSEVLPRDGSVYTLYFAGKRNGVPFTISRPVTLAPLPWPLG